MRTRLVCVLLVVAVAGLGLWYWLVANGPDDRLRRARAALQRGDNAVAVDEYERLVAGGHHDHALLLRGEELVLARRYEEALSVLGEVRDRSGLGLQAIALSGRCLLERGNLHAAEEAFALVLAELERSPAVAGAAGSAARDAHRGLAAVRYDQGALPRAVAHCETWADLDPADGRPHRFRGVIYQDLGQYRAAADAYAAALTRELADSVAWETRADRARCLLKISEPGAALEALGEAKPPAPQATAVLTLRAECQRSLGQAAAAVALVEQAVVAAARAPEATDAHAEALRLRGRLRLDSDDVKGALADLAESDQLKPQEYQTHHLLAQAHARAGNADLARAEASRVKEIQGWMDELTRMTRELTERPRDAALHERMADYYGKMQLDAPARRHRRLAVALRAGGAKGP